MADPPEAVSEQEQRLIGICTHPDGEGSWWEADSTNDLCPCCGGGRSEFYVPADRERALVEALTELMAAAVARIGSYHEQGRFTRAYNKARRTRDASLPPQEPKG